jgi:hypothetical protein
MLEQINGELVEWIKKTLSFTSVEVRLDVSDPAEDVREVMVYLMEFRSLLTPRAVDLPPLQFQARYVITVRASTPEETHHLLEELVFAALAERPNEVRLDPPPADWWAASGLLPQPALMLEIPVWRERPQPEHKLVLKPLVLRTTAIGDLYGVIMGPGEMPISGALVEMPDMHRTERTDAYGRFCFRTVPAGLDEARLIVKARGRKLEAVVSQPTSADEPVVIHISLSD